MRSTFLGVLTIILVATTAGICNGDGEVEGPDSGEDGLRRLYYRESCPSAETLVKNLTYVKVSQNPTLSAKLLRLHFHDCFVRGCDGSILLNSTPENTAEKDAPPNLTLGGFEVIDEIKLRLEEECPGVVSCADILALAARDAVSYQFGWPLWKVFTGRKDGTISLASEALDNLPSPFLDFPALKQAFDNKGLDVMSLVALSGAHTIGISHCGAVVPRLYNFTGKGDADPSLDPAYAEFLRTKCHPNFDPTTVLEMDPNSALSFDSHYYVTVLQHKGLFHSDAALLDDAESASFVNLMTNQEVFLNRFGHSMTKMSEIEVLTGNNGEIRKQCRFVK